MNWHYEKNGTPVGPVTEAQLDAARSRGEVQPMTRVWREGWADWKTAGEVWPGTAIGSPSLPSGVPMNRRCAECGKPHAELISLGGVLVCPECKPRALAKMREGVAIGAAGGAAGPWRDGKYLVVTPHGPMPTCCVKCGGPAEKTLRKTLTWHHPALYFIILVGLLVYLIVALIVRKTAKLQVPVCSQCMARRRRNIAIAWLSFLVGVGLIFTSAFWVSDEDLSTWVGLSGGAFLLFALIWAVAIQFILAKKITDQFVWIRKVSPNMLGTLPQFPGV
jgi:DNA-directed RNA polymerase subunit RPC12/RpoP